jgi:hypothetical protein
MGSKSGLDGVATALAILFLAKAKVAPISPTYWMAVRTAIWEDKLDR